MSNLDMTSRVIGAVRPGVRTAPDLYHLRLKRVLDVLFVLAVSLPVLLLVAVLWLLTVRDGGPGFFGHKRVGQGGRAFRCWKVRTMVPDAEARLAQHLAENPEAAAEWAREHKLTCDPRVTPLGHLLRRTSLDELPQFWNVLRGDMSVVGPRPVIEAELDRYGAGRAAYLAVRPGVTGLWQVSGRNDVSYDERVEMDRTYAQAHSFGMDTEIILRTLRAVVRRTGR